MKKSIIILVVVLFSQLVYSNPNYKNGNGTILSFSEKNGTKTIVRKCIINNVKIGDLLQEPHRTIYEDYSFNKPIGKLQDNDTINVLEVCTTEYVHKSKDTWDSPIGELWYKIKVNNVIGYICVSKDLLDSYTNPYHENRYEVLEEIRTAKKWTVRKLEQTVSIWEKVTVRDKPGLEGKKVFVLHALEEQTLLSQENYEVLAITEETDTIDGLRDHWLKIEYAPNKYGWIFGGYASVERGGPKYYKPENIIIFDLTWY